MISCRLDNGEKKQENHNERQPKVEETELKPEEPKKYPPISRSEITTILDSLEYKEKLYKRVGTIYHIIDSISPDFNNFYTRFLNDTAFQIKRIAFPVIGYHSICNGESGKIVKENWRYWQLDFRKDFYNNELDSNLFIQNDSIFFYENYRHEIGTLAIIGFEKINDKWMLVLFDFNPC